MSLKSRLRRLDAGVRWLETEGVFVRAQLATKLHGMLQDMSDHAAAHPEVASQWKNIRHLLPPPRVKERALAPVPLRQELPEARPGGAPRKEAAPVQAKPPPEEPRAAARSEGEPARPPPDPLPGQPASFPPADMQIRPVHWRQRGAQDYYDEDDPPGTNGRCITEYDPLADEDEP